MPKFLAICAVYCVDATGAATEINSSLIVENREAISRSCINSKLPLQLSSLIYRVKSLVTLVCKVDIAALVNNRSIDITRSFNVPLGRTICCVQSQQTCTTNLGSIKSFIIQSERTDFSYLTGYLPKLSAIGLETI